MSFPPLNFWTNDKVWSGIAKYNWQSMSNETRWHVFSHNIDKELNMKEGERKWKNIFILRHAVLQSKYILYIKSSLRKFQDWFGKVFCWKSQYVVRTGAHKQQSRSQAVSFAPVRCCGYLLSMNVNDIFVHPTAPLTCGHSGDSIRKDSLRNQIVMKSTNTFKNPGTTKLN